ncbi:MAG: GIY-YIG nuclease family protein [Chromatiales bacterium]|nr:GIY-YIG nuclease family protein [Chromatiales bacterium]
MELRDTIVYELKKGNEIVYIGTTNDPERRKREHETEGKVFDSMNLVSGPVTEDEAKRIEKELLAEYRQRHNGKNPKYNKDSDG